MQLRDIMTTDVEVIAQDATIGEAAKKMKALDVGALPVCDGERLCGMITDRDIAVRAVAEGRDAHSAVRDSMTDEVVYCFEDQEYEDAAALMRQHQVRRLPVVNREKRLVGVVARRREPTRRRLERDCSDGRGRFDAVEGRVGSRRFRIDSQGRLGGVVRVAIALYMEQSFEAVCHPFVRPIKAGRARSARRRARRRRDGRLTTS
jgi:CBS domain-containing protein